MINKLPVSEIKLNPNNPRLIKDDKFKKLVQSIKDFPEMANIRPVVLNKDHIILGGNMRFRAMKEAGWKEIPVAIVDLPEDKQREFVIKDNVSGGEWDWQLLANEWDTKQLDDWGLDLPKDMQEEPEVEEDEAPEVDESEPPKSKLGEIYQLGRHRIMCGDSTDFGSISELLNGNEINTIFTDPPYGMNAVTKSGVLSKNYKNDILNDSDNKVAIKTFDITRILNANIEVWWGANYYSSALPDSECWIVWNKNNGESDQTDAELAWGNMRSVVRMYKQSSEKTNRVHPTQKPVELAIWVFNKFKSQNSILDLFLGSGSTLIACEQTDRVCYGMELDPKYVDVIRKRWAKFIYPDTWEERWEELTPAIM